MSSSHTQDWTFVRARNGMPAKYRNALLCTSASTLALLVAAPVGAQQIIGSGENRTVTSVADGETITAGLGVTSTVDGAPVVVVANNAVSVGNAGTLATTGVTQTVQVNQGTTGTTISNAATGRLEGASRVVNFDGTDATLNNDGVILGTGSQRNGAVYGNRTSNNITINNAMTGLIDAGVEGAGIAIEVGGGGAPRGGAIDNAGTIQGRGQGAAGGGTAGDGIRFFGPGLAPAYVYAGDINNSGLINSESTQGTAAGIRFANRIGFQGTLTNAATGVISGAQNGLYFGNDADHTGGVVDNLAGGTISSNSRALNIDGLGLTINNAGRIIGTGNQRNGTVYSDSTGQSFTLNNLAGGVIDAGVGNQGAGFSAELAAAGNDFDITNAGTIQGRGQADAGSALAGDGLRFERERNAMGMLDGTTTGLFTGTITNSGLINSESTQGTTAGIRFVNGVSFQGTLNNLSGGIIDGAQNGLYFGNAVPAGGADHTGGVVNNAGVIRSASRALNIDGTGLVVNNLATGQIIGTGNQRNGTVYADGTANNFIVNNAGLIDAGMGNAGSGVSLQLGEVGGEMRNFTLTNSGTIAGRGAALPSGANAGLRLFSDVAGVTVDGSITNSGTITSTNAAGLLIENVAFNGTVTNSGTIAGAVNAVDASNATAALNFVQNGGALNGNFVGSAFADRLTFGTGAFTLNSNILNGVAVTTNAGSVITVNGPRSVNGGLLVNGTLNFDLGTDTIAVTGNTVLGAGSRINIATDLITSADVGRTIDVLTDTGTFTNNGALINIADNDFLFDFNVVGSLAVAVSATNLGNLSDDANVNSFGSATTTAVANNRLQSNVFAAFNNAGTQTQFEAIALSLLPAINDGVTREIYETQRFASSLVQDRLGSEGTGLWGQAFARTADRDGSSLSSLGYDADAVAFTLGLDRQLSENTTIGALLSYAEIDVDANGTAGAQSEITAYQIGGYAGFDLGDVFVNAELGYSFSSVDSARTALGAPITGESDVDGFYGSINAGYDLDAGGVIITPNIGLRYAELSQDIFTETGGLGLTLDADGAELVEARIGARIAGAGTTGVIPFASVDYAYDLNSDPLATAGSFNGGADTFIIVADEASRSRFDIAAGLDFVNEGGLSIGAEYRGRFASDYQSHTGGISVRFVF